MTTPKPAVGAKIDEISFPIVGSDNMVSIGQLRIVGPCCLYIVASIAHAVSGSSIS